MYLLVRAVVPMTKVTKDCSVEVIEGVELKSTAVVRAGWLGAQFVPLMTGLLQLLPHTVAATTLTQSRNYNCSCCEGSCLEEGAAMPLHPSEGANSPAPQLMPAIAAQA